MTTNSGEVATRQRGATARRHVVLGAVEGGPAGAAAAATAPRKRVSAASSETATGARPSRVGRASRATSKRGKSFAIGRLEGPASGALFAEYFAAAFIITIELFTKSATEGYTTTMSRVLIRLTALTSVFFVLFLMTGSKRGGQVAIWFGLLVDLGVIFTAARGQAFTTLADEISGKGTGITLDSASSALNVPHPEQTQLPDE